MFIVEGRGNVAALWRRFAIIFAVGLCLGLPAAALAAEPMEVSADEYSVWDGSRLFVAQGNVTVRYRGALITSDALHYDSEAAYAVFSGNVFYLDDDQELTGSSLHYDLDAGVATFDGMDAVLYSDGVDGPMFVRGDRVRAADGEVRIERARLTTCECTGDTPAYHFAAKELEIYPNDRIVVRSVTFYDHRVPLLYLPYLTLSLKEDTSRFDMPQIGYSERTGWYVKLTYNYVLKSGLYGALLFDYFQKLGPGGGVRHTYVDNETGQGSVYVYGVGNEYGGADAAFAWERRWKGSPWDVRAQYAYDASVSSVGFERERLHAGAVVTRTTGTDTMSADVDYRLDTGGDVLQRLSAAAQVRQRLGDDWYVRLDGEAFDEWSRERRRRWIGYSGELQQVTPGYTLLARVERQFNPDLKDKEKTGEPDWTHVHRFPEVTLKLRRVAGIDVQLAAARLVESTGIAAGRGEANVGLATRTLRLGRIASFNWSGSARGRAYTTEQQQLTLQSRASVNVQIARPLSATLQYNYRDVWGETPFRFDRVSPSETLSPRLNWRSRAVTASLSTSYNLLTEKWSVVTGNATVRVTPNLLVRGTGTYDLAQQTLNRVIGTLDWRIGEDSRVRIGGSYDVPKQAWDRVDADIELSVTGGWKAGLKTIFQVTKNEFTRNHMYISHDACGCREVRLRYDQTKGEVWLEYHITAFPSSRVAVGAGDDAFMFESDALTDFLNE